MLKVRIARAQAAPYEGQTRHAPQRPHSRPRTRSRPHPSGTSRIGQETPSFGKRRSSPPHREMNANDAYSSLRIASLCPLNPSPKTDVNPPGVPCWDDPNLRPEVWNLVSVISIRFRAVGKTERSVGVARYSIRFLPRYFMMTCAEQSSTFGNAARESKLAGRKSMPANVRPDDDDEPIVPKTKPRASFGGFNANPKADEPLQSYMVPLEKLRNPSVGSRALQRASPQAQARSQLPTPPASFVHEDDVETEEPSSALVRIPARAGQLVRSTGETALRVGQVATLPSLLVLLLSLLSWAAWYRDGVLQQGYCNSLSSLPRSPSAPPALTGQIGSPSNDLFDWAGPALSLTSQPVCLPCPPHGRCSNGQLECKPDFLRRSGALGLGVSPHGPNLLPVAERCDPDPDKEIREARLAFRIRNQLRAHRGLNECRTAAPVAETCFELGVKEDQLKDDLYQSGDVSGNAFDFLFCGANLTVFHS